MARLFQLWVAPFKAWEGIATDDRGMGFVLFLVLLPVVALTLSFEGYGLVRWGESRGFNRVTEVSRRTVRRYVLLEGALNVSAVFASAALLLAVARSSNMRTTFRPCFTVAAYAFTALFWVRILDAHPISPTWLCWGVGMVVAAVWLYHGVGSVLKPDQTKGFGLFLVSVVTVMATSGLAHFTAVSVLHRRIWI